MLHMTTPDAPHELWEGDVNRLGVKPRGFPFR